MKYQRKNNNKFRTEQPALLTREDMHDYQHRAVNFIKGRYSSAIHLDMGLGKTVSVATALSDLFNEFAIYGALILGPRRVVETVWHVEAKKWKQLTGLDVCVLRGKRKDELARELLLGHQVYVLNYEAIPWLVTQLNELFLAQEKYPPFNAIIFDESTRVKNPDGKRFQYLAPFLKYFDFRVGLTGTPSPNGYLDLFGQYLALDDGKRLGSSYQVYKEQYFIEANGKWRPAPGSKEKIQAKVADMTLSMQADDYLKLPPYQVVDYWVDLPSKLQRDYDQLEEELWAEIGDRVIRLFSHSAKQNKCRQFANGTIIDPDISETFIPVHDLKIEVLESVIEENGGRPVLMSYVYRSDMPRIVKKFGKHLNVQYLGPGVSDVEANDIVNEWNKGSIDLLMSHHQSAGHGLNIQFGGNDITHFGMDFNLEGYLQINARLRRQGQREKTVFVRRFLTRNTIDELIVRTMEIKEGDQKGFRNAVEAYRRNRGWDG